MTFPLKLSVRSGVCDFVSSIWTCSLSELVDLGYMVHDFVSLENLPKKI